MNLGEFPLILIDKHSEEFNQEIENIKNQIELKDMIIEIKCIFITRRYQ